MASKPASPSDSNWPKDEFGRHETIAQSWPFILIGTALGTSLLFSAGNWLHRSGNEEVIAYCAQDQIYAEPIFRDFEKATGIRVRPVFDSEAVKTVGLANRLLAERSHPQCDVFWGNEEMRIRQLAAAGVFRPTNGWVGFGFRSRRLVVNTNLVKVSEAPKSLLDLTNSAWRGRVALAYPLFGTTATHFHALRQAWGDEAWRNWCRALAANKPFLVDGNSVVVRLVGRGEAAVGLTDSDDIAAGIREGLPVAAAPLSAESLLIPNTVGFVNGAPHPRAAARLYDYLQQPEAVTQLVSAGALEAVGAQSVMRPGLTVRWDSLLSELETTSTNLAGIFLR